MQIEDANFEVTNDSRLPLKINDAKLLHVLEWKREKERMMNERNKQIMDKLQRRMESSSLNRQYAMIEEVRHKARMTNNGGDHLKKWRLKMQTLREAEERGAKGYIEEVERRREAEKQRSELCRSVQVEQAVNKKEGLEVEQYRSRLKLEREEMEVKESFDRLRMLEMKLAMRAQNQMQNMDDKLSPIKTRNTELMRKIHTI